MQESPSTRPGRWLQFASVLLLGLCATGCSTLPNGRGWGQDAIYPLQWKRIPQAAKNALLDPATWIPAAGAALFAIDDWDEKTARWATERTPIFGSQETADNASDVMLTALGAVTLVTAVATPGGDEPLEWSWAKAKGLAVEYGAVAANQFLTEEIKEATGRDRPDGPRDSSFPSLHASSAATFAALANRNVKSIAMPTWARTSVQVTTTTTAAAVGWARIEARKHFPTDVLAGAALGNFLSVFIHDAFMNLPEDSQFGFRIEPSPKGVWAAVSWDF